MRIACFIPSMLIAALATAASAQTKPAIPASSGPVARQVALKPDQPNAIDFEPVEAKFVRVIVSGHASQPCIDELEVYSRDGNANLALAERGASAAASSCLPGHAPHQVAHLNDGRYGNSRSWIPAGATGEWAQIELKSPASVARVVISRDREGRYRDRVPDDVEVRVSSDGGAWKTVARIRSGNSAPPRTIAAAPPPLTTQPSERELLQHVFDAEARTRRLDSAGVLKQTEAMLDRFEARGIDVSRERIECEQLSRRLAALPRDESDKLTALFHEIRLAKRRLMLRDPQLACLRRILMVKRHPLNPSHNYSDIMDSRFRAGGGIVVLSIPLKDGRLEPGEASVATLFDGSRGIARDPSLSFDGKTVYFAYRPMDRSAAPYWHLYSMSIDGSGVRQLTDGPFHDYYPCELPDGGVCFVSTRCRQRFLCWVPMSMVLFRMSADGSEMRALSHSNLSEWGPSIMRDGRILWTRSEYQDKGADYGHTLWAARPDGSYPELIYGNNSNYNLMNGTEVPDSQEICATSISHFGDFNGPIILIDPAKGRYSRESVTVLTPDHMATSNAGNFRDPLPISHDYFLVSHRPSSQFGIYVIDRWGNRELLYMDVNIGSMAPQPVRPRTRPPVIASNLPATRPAAQDLPGRMAVMDVYEGLGAKVARGSIKYIRVVQEMPSPLEELPDGRLKETYPDFHRYYASPTDQISGPHGWPSYVAKGVFGIAPVEEDGSAYFEAPAGKTIYFQALDADLTEVQRMRSVVQLQPGEFRGCVGCHESRTATMPPTKMPAALRREASKLQPPPWGAGPFGYQQVVQPVLDTRCITCHSAAAGAPKPDLRGVLDKNKLPASYTSLIRGGYVHYFNMNWHLKHELAEPLSFGAARSKLFAALQSEPHKDVKLTRDELHAIKCWIDLNVPLWPDYKHVKERPTSLVGPDR